jgi:hypothetical protein
MEDYAKRVNDLLHDALGGTLFYRQEVIEVPGLLSGLLVTYDDIQDDSREIRDQLSWEEFQQRMSVVKPDWSSFDQALFQQLATRPEKVMGGWEGRTVYFIKGGRHPQQWTSEKASLDVTLLLTASWRLWGSVVREEVNRLREMVPIGREHFSSFERIVRVVFNFLFRDELGAGRAQSRTEPENEGIEIRDILFSNVAEGGFWHDLKVKYSASEIVVDAKNTDELTRDDLRQIYCYLKPALGLWGFIVCRSPQPERMHAFNRTLFKNFSQTRGVLILTDDDLRRMVELANRGQSPSAYLRDRMSDFVRSI